MAFKDLVGDFDKLLRKHDNGKDPTPKELDRIQKVLEDKQAKYRARLEAGDSSETPAQTELRLEIVEAQLAKLEQVRE